MAVRLKAIQEALEGLLPRTVNYAQDEDTGDKDFDAVFARVQEVIQVALLLDPNAIFRLIFLSSRRLKQAIETAIDALDGLQSSKLLRAVTEEPPVRVEDDSRLEKARQHLFQLRVRLAGGGGFSESLFNSFKSEILGFLQDQVVPNLQGRNRVILEQEIRAAMESLQSAWDDVLERRVQLFELLGEYGAADLKGLVSETVTATVDRRLSEANRVIVQGSAQEQAAAAETIIVDSAAGQAALNIVASAPDFTGEVVLGPADDGATERTYLVLEGTFRPEPLIFILRGRKGKVFIDLVLSSLTGVLFDDGDSDDVTPYLDDTDFSLVSEGMFVTFTKVGRVHRVAEVVSNTRLSLVPEVSLNLSDTRYIVTEKAPGSYLRDESGEAEDFQDDPVASFWTEFSGGETGSVIVASGTTGEFIEDNKSSGSDGSNEKSSGSDGDPVPRLGEGTDGEILSTIASGTTASIPFGGSTLTDATADFLTSGVEVGDVLEVLVSGVGNEGVYTISGVTTTVLTISGTFPGTGSDLSADYEVRDVDTFEAPSGNFVSSGLASGDEIELTGYGTFIIDEVLSETEVSLTSDIPETASTSGVTWVTRAADADELFDAAGGDFIVNLVEVGDVLRVTDTAVAGDYTVTEVVSGTRLRVTPVFGSDPVSSANWEIRLADGVFRSESANFQSEGVEAGDEIEVSGVGTFPVLSVEGQHYLTVDGSFTPFEGFDGAAFEVREVNGSGDPISSLFVPDTALDLSAVPADPDLGVELTELNIAALTQVSSAPEYKATGLVVSGDEYDIIRQEDTTTLEVSPEGVVASGLTWEIRFEGGTTRFVDTVNAPFGGFVEGDILVLQPGTPDEERAAISEIVSASEVVLAVEVTPDLSGIDYAVISLVKPGMEVHSAGRRMTIIDVVDATTLLVDPPLPVAVGLDIEYLVVSKGTEVGTRRFVDDERTVTEGFDSSFVGLEIELFLDRPERGVIKRVEDYRTLDVSTRLKIGKRAVSYRLRSDLGGLTGTLLTAEDASGLLDDDVLTVWGRPETFLVSAPVEVGEVPIAPKLPVDLEDQDFVVVRGGSAEHGRYVLFDAKNGEITLDENLEQLRLHVAEVLTDFGGDIENITSGTSGVLVDDLDGDDKTGIFEDPSADFSEAEVGDRLELTLSDTSTARSYLTSVASATRITVDPELSTSLVITSWSLDRSSVSFALKEASRLQGLLEDLLEVVDAYTAPVSVALDGALAVLREHGMDRAVNLLLDGEFATFAALEASTSTFSGSARSAVQSLGGSLDTSQQDENVAGSTAGNDASATTATQLGEDAEAVVGLASTASTLAASERTKTVAQTSQDELRNRSIYYLVGEVESGLVTDTDPTLPWVAETGSAKQRLTEDSEKALAALQYIIDHPEEFASG